MASITKITLSKEHQGGVDLEICGQRLRALRKSGNYTQAKFAKLFGIGQSRVARYENGEAALPLDLLVKISDYFGVSADYILGRTECPQGMHYELKFRVSGMPEMKRFVEACFDSGSPLNERLRQAMFQKLKEGQE